MTRFRSLTARLTVTAVALVAVVSLVIGTATTLVMRETLSQRLDREVESALARALGGPPGPDGQQQIFLGSQAPGTLVAVLGDEPQGGLVGDRRGETRELDRDDLELLQDLGDRRGTTEVTLPRHGDYQVAAAPVGGSVVVVGLPTEEVDEAVVTLLLVELVLGAVAVVVAGGAASLVVRRQLRPLREVAGTAHEVATLPLASGEVVDTPRVPERLTDEHTEVGQVGAALNTLLDHVASSLEARHRSEQQVRQFVADASHELRTPLSTIQGYAELAQARPDDAGAVRQAVAKVRVESRRMSSLVEDLLLLARLDAGRPLDQEPVDLTRLLLEAVTDARVVAPDHHWRLRLPDEPIEVVGDGPRLHQVLTNLLTNARKYAPPGTTVTVTGDVRGFSVHDDGPGFPPGLVDHAFERFTRGDAARTREADSSAGLGLAIVQAIVTAHGGRVALRSAPGDTVVRVDLP